ncbi:hypothetical protein OIU84_024325 [Salix udensis]|uniref:Peptidyl-prolyl cis-trans isomerase CYP38-like PsbQ-like domain-containing protein n=2 Tax=Salix udensis TaxID=889485 RepID=A0AAD6PCE7_9ROSI|nr:hypothetical protein OIU84_024325 [Salix udensis]
MALPLSSSSIILSSKKLSFNVSISRKSTQKHLLLSAHFAFRPNEARSQVTARPAVRACNSTTSTYAKDLTCEHNFPPNWYMSIFGDGTKKLKSLIAMILIFMQISAPVPLSGWDFWYVSPAKAVLYSPDTKVPRTGELALRKAIPANINMKSIQTSLEDISYLLRIPQRKPYGTMEGNVKKALKIAKDEKDSILASIPADLKETGSTLYASLIDGKGGLQALLQCIQNQDPDRVSVGLASSLDTVAELELLQAPGLSFFVASAILEISKVSPLQEYPSTFNSLF